MTDPVNTIYKKAKKMNQQLVQRQNQIKPLLLASQRQITSLLQDEVKAKKFMAASLVVASDSSLSRCSADSIVQALIGVAMSDLNIDKNIGHCYLVPYGDSVQLQIGYKGFIQLLFRAGWMVKCFPVYLCDQFSMSFDGWDNKVDFIPNIDERDEGDKEWVFNNLRGVYVVARHADTKDEYSTFVSKAVIEKLRLNSPNQRIGKFTKPEDKKRLEAGLPIGVWADWYIEMAQSKAIKKLAKILPIGDSRAQTAISADDKAESGAKVDYKNTAESGVVIEMSASEKTVTNSSEDPTLDDILEAIDSASSKKELDDVLPAIDDLKPADKKAARKAWLEKDSTYQTKRSAEQNENKATEKPTDWQRAIKECGDVDTLNALLEGMPEETQIELGDLIDEQFDLLRSTH
jgi:recombination protein RecT